MTPDKAFAKGEKEKIQIPPVVTVAYTSFHSLSLLLGWNTGKLGMGRHSEDGLTPQI